MNAHNLTRKELATIDLVILDNSGGQVTSYVPQIEIWIDGECVDSLHGDSRETHDEAYEVGLDMFDRFTSLSLSNEALK